MIVSKPPLSSPEAYFDNLSLIVDNSVDNIKRNVLERVSSVQMQFGQLVSKIDALSPLKTLTRGFTAVKSGGRVVTGVSQLHIGDNINLRFADGVADAAVTALRSNDEQ